MHNRSRGTAAGLAVLAIALFAEGCTHLPQADPSMSLAFSSRIAAAGIGQDWYSDISLVDQRPDAIKRGTDVDLAPAEIRLVPGVDPQSPAIARACKAIAAVVNDPKFGPPLNITSMDLYNDLGSYSCDAVQAPEPSSTT